jgi:hypothetical protein
MHIREPLIIQEGVTRRILSWFVSDRWVHGNPVRDLGFPSNIEKQGYKRLHLVLKAGSEEGERHLFSVDRYHIHLRIPSYPGMLRLGVNKAGSVRGKVAKLVVRLKAVTLKKVIDNS